jgi:predicted dehydrogenase
MALKVAIAGIGKAGRDLHLSNYLRLPEVEVVALCDFDLARAEEIAAGVGGARAYRTLQDALEDAAVDIVSICTPPSTHFELAKFAMEHGASVLVEKPIFQTVDEARDFQRVMQRTGGKFSAVHNKKYHPGIQQAVDLVSEGYIGTVSQIHSVWMINGDKNRMTRDRDFWCHSLPGGRWQEMLPHQIYQAYQFMGPMDFRHLEMKTVSNRWPWLPADELEIILEGRSGYVSIKLSANTEKYSFMLVYGSQRTLFVDSGKAVDLLASVRSKPPTTGITRAMRKRAQRLLAGILPASPEAPPMNLDAHGQLIQDFVAYVRGERSQPPVSWDEAFNTLELTLTIGQAIRSRWTVSESG